MSQQCPTCRLYNPDTALRCDCGYDFETKEQRPSYLVVETARKHGGFHALLHLQARRNMRAGFSLLGVGIALALVGSLLSASMEDARNRRAILPAGLVAWGLILVIRGYNQKSAAARVARPSDASESQWVDRS